MKRLILASIVLVFLGVLASGHIRSFFFPANLDSRGDAYWKSQFLRLADSENQAFHQHDVHPTRGWVNKPHFQSGTEIQETINDRGMRAQPDYAPHPEKYTIVVLGDSFTYGAWVDDSAVWPSILQRTENRFSVLNLAVGGYGVDQMYLALRETIDEYKPQLVILALIPDDLDRCLLGFREYRKPRFILSASGELELTNTPIADIANTKHLLRAEYGYITARGKLLKEDAATRNRITGGDYDREKEALSSKLIEATIGCATEHGADFILLHLDACPWIPHQAGKPYAPLQEEELFERLAHEKGVTFLPTREAFQKAGIRWPQASHNHYLRPEAEFVAGCVHTRIKQLASWNEYVEKADRHQ